MRASATRVGVLVAFRLEAISLAGRRGWRRHGPFAAKTHSTPKGEILWCISGTGDENGAQAARWLAKQGVHAIINAGVSGGLDPALQGGDLIFAEQVRDAEDRVWTADPLLLKQAARACRNTTPVHRGAVLSTPEALLTPSEKKAVFLRSRCLAVDLEAGAVARQADSLSIPFLAIRSICDRADDHVASECLDILGKNGRVSIRSLCRAVLCRPAVVVDLMAMQSRFSRAIGRLKANMDLVLASFCKGNRFGNFDAQEQQARNGPQKRTGTVAGKGEAENGSNPG